MDNLTPDQILVARVLLGEPDDDDWLDVDLPLLDYYHPKPDSEN